MTLQSQNRIDSISDAIDLIEAMMLEGKTRSVNPPSNHRDSQIGDDVSYNLYANIDYLPPMDSLILIQFRQKESLADCCFCF